MIYLIASVIIAIMLFYCAYLGYKEGLRLGMLASKQIIPEPMKSPLKAITDIKKDIELSKEQQEEMREIEMMMAYNGDIPKEK